MKIILWKIELGVETVLIFYLFRKFAEQYDQVEIIKKYYFDYYVRLWQHCWTQTRMLVCHQKILPESLPPKLELATRQRKEVLYSDMTYNNYNNNRIIG